MKTFETEKHNIPEGATHYINETGLLNFRWVKKDCSRYSTLIGKNWVEVDFTPYTFLSALKPIPQTKEVEWEGEYQLEHGSGWFKYRHTYIASSGDMFAICLVPDANNGNPFEQYLDSATTKFRDLETETEKIEREFKESVEVLLSDKIKFNNPLLPSAIARVLFNAGYTKPTN